ncbi:MAG: YdcH family protein [Burkholderiales bacterium]|nr:YdcH family protein [Burkholderiales bacterium]
MLTEEIEKIKHRIIELGIEHRDLDDAIARLTADAEPNELQIRRLKKRKLWLKDEMARLQMQITPDIRA